MSSYLDYEQRVKPLTGPLVPLLPPKSSSRTLPALDLRSSTESPFGPKHPTWRCDTFVVPAAFPRSVNGSTVPSGSAKVDVSGHTPAQRVDIDKALLELYKGQSEAMQSEIDFSRPGESEDQEQLFIAVNRYRSSTPRNAAANGPGLTLVFSHANGFHKEIWEPAMGDLLDALDAKTRPIEEMWALDCALQGDSGFLNEEVIGATFSWADHGRDLVNFLLSYIDSPSLSENSSSIQPTLKPVTGLEASLLRLDAASQPSGPSAPAARLWRNKLIVGVGHSMGGTATTFASTADPSLFSSIILCDPGLPPTSQVASTSGKAGGALSRRDRWASRPEASEAFLKKEFFRAWDTRVLQKYVQHALKDSAAGVELKTRAKDEALVFGDPMGSSSRRAYSRLHMLPAELPVHFIFAEEGRSVHPESSLRDILGQVKHATHARVNGAGHLLVHERPKETAEAIAAVLKRTYPLENRARL